MSAPKLTIPQLRALAEVARDPAAMVREATVAVLVRRGLVARTARGLLLTESGRLTLLGQTDLIGSDALAAAGERWKSHLSEQAAKERQRQADDLLLRKLADDPDTRSIVAHLPWRGLTQEGAKQAKVADLRAMAALPQPEAVALIRKAQMVAAAIARAEGREEPLTVADTVRAAFGGDTEAQAQVAALLGVTL